MPVAKAQVRDHTAAPLIPALPRKAGNILPWRREVIGGVSTALAGTTSLCPLPVQWSPLGAAQTWLC